MASSSSSTTTSRGSSAVVVAATVTCAAIASAFAAGVYFQKRRQQRHCRTIGDSSGSIDGKTIIGSDNDKEVVTNDNNNNLLSAYEQIIGQTPLVELSRLSALTGRNILVKMESSNPGGTGKDRAARGMLRAAERAGRLPPPVSSKTTKMERPPDTTPRAAADTTLKTTATIAGSSSEQQPQKTAYASTNSATLDAATGVATSITNGVLDACIVDAMKRSSTGGLVVEGTSGSTGIALAMLCRAAGHGLAVVLPEDQATEKTVLLRALGAVVLRVPCTAIAHPQHYVNTARRLAQRARSSFHNHIPAIFVDQFENQDNWQTHYRETGPEIWQQCRAYQAANKRRGRKILDCTTTPTTVAPVLDAFCMSAGTGGTLAGVSRYLKEQTAATRTRTSLRTGRNNENMCRCVLVDPPGSVLYHKVEHGVAYTSQQQERGLKRHRYDTIAEGIGLDRITANLAAAGLDNDNDDDDDCDSGCRYVDAAVRVSDQEAVDMAHWLLSTEGLWVGSSSAMNVVGAVRTALELPPGSTVVTVLCDKGDRHVTRFWNRDFCREWGLQWPGDKEEIINNMPMDEKNGNGTHGGFCGSIAQQQGQRIPNCLQKLY